MPLVIIYPKPSAGNPYIKNLGEAIEKQSNVEVRFIESIAHVNKIKADVLYVNWLETYVVSENDLINTVHFIQKILVMASVKMRGIKIVYTMHNKFPHKYHTSRYSKKLGQLFIRFMTHVSDRIIVHSDYAKKYCQKQYNVGHKTLLIPHGNYSVNYDHIDKEDKAFVTFGFVGQIKPYKGIEALIESFISISDETCELLIVGKASCDIYTKKIKDLCDKDLRITLKLGFIEDADIPRLFSKIDYIVLPYAGESFLTSGSAILSISQGTPFIAPLEGMFYDYVDEPYAMIYDSEQKSGLNDKMREALTFSKDKRFGMQKLALKAARNNSWDMYKQAIVF